MIIFSHLHRIITLLLFVDIVGADVEEDVADEVAEDVADEVAEDVADEVAEEAILSIFEGECLIALAYNG